METVRSVLKWLNGLVKPANEFKNTDVKPIVNTLNDDEILTDDEDDDFIYWKVKGNKRSYPRKYWSPRNSPTFKRIALNQKPLLELSAEKIAKKADESEEHDSEQAEFVDKLAESIKSDNADVKPLITNMDLTLISKEIIVGIIDKDTEDNEEQPNIISQNNDNELYPEPMP